MSDQEARCICGHPERDHYEYILNGRPQTRCHSCDPSRRWEGDVAVAALSLTLVWAGVPDLWIGMVIGAIIGAWVVLGWTDAGKRGTHD